MESRFQARSESLSHSGPALNQVELSDRRFGADSLIRLHNSVVEIVNRCARTLNHAVGTLRQPLHYSIWLRRG
jgi:hypothetical protein